MKVPSAEPPPSPTLLPPGGGLSPGVTCWRPRGGAPPDSPARAQLRERPAGIVIVLTPPPNNIRRPPPSATTPLLHPSQLLLTITSAPAQPPPPSSSAVPHYQLNTFASFSSFPPVFTVFVWSPVINKDKAITSQIYGNGVSC